MTTRRSAQKTKDELVAEADAAGVDVKAHDTKAEIAEKLADVPAGGNVVDDGIVDVDPNPAQVGQWVDIIDGEHAGKHAAYLAVTEENKDGSPKTISVRTRDADNQVVEVPYESVRLATYSGGR